VPGLRVAEHPEEAALVVEAVVAGRELEEG
jgi:hypothetical protein